MKVPTKIWNVSKWHRIIKCISGMKRSSASNISPATILSKKKKTTRYFTGDGANGNDVILAERLERADDSAAEHNAGDVTKDKFRLSKKSKTIMRKKKSNSIKLSSIMNKANIEKANALKRKQASENNSVVLSPVRKESDLKEVQGQDSESAVRPTPTKRKKRSKVKTKEIKIQHNLNYENLKDNVSALLQLSAKESSSENALFKDEAQPVFMIVENIRVPKVILKTLRFCLPHPLVDEFSEVCLFVPNLKAGKRRNDFEDTIEHYKNILEQHKVQGITQIMPLRQIETEYDRFELREHLVSQFDMFLVDGRISGHTHGLLGKKIYIRRKLPIPVDLRVNDLKQEVDKALSKTQLMVHGCGNKSCLRVAHTKHSVQQIAENIIAVAEGLAKRYPGGWKNIRSLRIHLQGTSPVPVYLSLKNSNDVRVPRVKLHQPKNAVPVSGMLSTMPGVQVTVKPDGELILKRMKLTELDKKMGLTEADLDYSDIEFDEFERIDEENFKEKNKIKEAIRKESLIKGSTSNSGKHDGLLDENEDETEDAENSYLKKWQEQRNAEIEKEVEEEEEEIERKKRKEIQEELQKEPQKKQKHKRNKKDQEIEDGKAEKKKTKTIEGNVQGDPQEVKQKTKNKVKKEKIGVKDGEVENRKSKKAKKGSMEI